MNINHPKRAHNFHEYTENFQQRGASSGFSDLGRSILSAWSTSFAKFFAGVSTAHSSSQDTSINTGVKIKNTADLASP